MRWHCSLFSQLLCNLSKVLFAACAISIASAQNPSAPTASQDPATIDQAWQKGSSKYDAQRAALLREVHKIDQEAPFLPDWEALQKYEAPDWYKDAKFGI